MKGKSTEHPFCWLRETISLSDTKDKTVSVISYNYKQPGSYPASSSLSFVFYTEKSHGMRNNHEGMDSYFDLQENP